MYEVPLPTTVGGSLIADPKKGGRVSGPPSKMFPVLRDLAEAKAEVTIEVDTERHRYQGLIRGISDRPGANQMLNLKQGAKPAGTIKMTDIIAFRVLKIEVDELPAIL